MKDYPSSSARVAASISSCRIRLSPTRNVRTPTAAIRWQSAWVEIPLSQTSSTSAGTSAASRSVFARSTSKVLRLRLLTPISRDCSRGQRTVELGSRRELPPARPSLGARGQFDFAHLRIVQRRNDDQDRIGPHRAGFGTLPRIDHEILPDHRQVAGRACGDQIVLVALKIRRIGQHRKAGRTARLIGTGMGGRVKISTDQSFGWRSSLYFCDQRKLRFSLCPQRCLKPAHGRRLRPVAQPQRLARGHFKAFGGADFGEFVGHYAASSAGLWAVSSFFGFTQRHQDVSRCGKAACKILDGARTNRQGQKQACGLNQPLRVFV